MKAVRIHQFGGAEVLRLEELPKPTPAAGELLIRVLAAGVNPVDYKIREGKFPPIQADKLPWTLGRDVAGRWRRLARSRRVRRGRGGVRHVADRPREAMREWGGGTGRAVREVRPASIPSTPPPCPGGAYDRRAFSPMGVQAPDSGC